MNQLTIAEKQLHHRKMADFVERINRCVMPSNLLNKVVLTNVAYGVKVDDANFYFDFPYDTNADVLNGALRNDPLIRGIDIRIHEAFFEHQKYDSNGYLAYEYKFDEYQKTFFLHAPITNLSIWEDDLLTYLPIIHSAVHLDTNFLKPAILTTALDSMSRVLVLCRWPYKTYNRDEEKNPVPYQADKDNILITTFEIINTEVSIDQHLADRLHQDVLFFADSYFTSPVLEKVFAERRKSEALAYHHSIDNLGLDTGINMLDDLATGTKDLDRKKLERFTIKLRALRLMHYLLFQTEYLFAGEPGINSNRIIFPLVNRNISDIINQLTTEYNQYKINYDTKVENDISKVDRTPLIGTIEDINPEFYDVILILWNLLQNAAIVSIGQDASKIAIDLREVKGKLKVSLTNQGKILKDFFDFINDNRKDYPPRPNKPNKRYHGLEIVKDKCRSHDRNWEFKVEVNEHSDHLYYTTVSVTL